MNDNQITEVAREMLKVLLENGGTPTDMIEIVSCLSGMVSCGLSFAVKGDMKLRRKAFQIQTDLAKATRRSIEQQDSDAFKVLSFEPMFTKNDEDNKPH